ncbi:hypothetical protein CWS01_16080 [Niallia nealsonii]|uniref:Uncharacterized protein n=1 Tax=Niallia nealsonii TaxID=115979 RepID=A0A2N0YZF1_9BACI|nr:hypothetical protein CWS01_16080 [Niallia nealsonii]
MRIRRRKETERKTDIAINLFKKGEVKEALKIAKTFRIGFSSEDRDKLVRAYECFVLYKVEQFCYSIYRTETVIVHIEQRLEVLE